MPLEPIVSIIINNYNYARYLPCAIESALAQKYSAVEVIVVDDGSSDSSAETIRVYEDRVISIVKPNGGQASALNAGFARSRGTYVLFLDSDDVLLPNAARRLVDRFLQSPVVKIAAPLLIIDADGKYHGRALPASALSDGDFLQITLERGPSSHVASPTSGNAWQRDYLEQIFPIPEVPFRLCADAYLIDNSPLFGRLAALAEPIGFYRVHGKNGWANIQVSCEVLDRYLELYELRCDFLEKTASVKHPVRKEEWLQSDSRYLLLAYLRWKMFSKPWKGWTLWSFISQASRGASPGRALKVAGKFLLMHFGPRTIVDRVAVKTFTAKNKPWPTPMLDLEKEDLSFSRILQQPSKI